MKMISGNALFIIIATIFAGAFLLSYVNTKSEFVYLLLIAGLILFLVRIFRGDD